MRIQKGEQLVCTSCGADFPLEGTLYPNLCDGCFCPHTVWEGLDDLAMYMWGHPLMDDLGIKTISDAAAKDVLQLFETETLNKAVPSLTWEDLVKHQAHLRQMLIRLGKLEPHDDIPSGT